MKRLLFIAASALLLVGCSREATREVRIGINAWPGYEFLVLAQEKGFFRDAGVTVHLVEFNSLSDGVSSYNNDQLDGLACTGVELLLARAYAPRKPKAIAVVDYSDGADVVIAKKSIATLADLRGKKVGVELGSLGGFMLHRALQKGELSYSDIHIVSGDQLSMETQFDAGELDAIVSYPPVSPKLFAKEGNHTLFSSDEIPGELVDLIALDEGIIQKHPEVATGIREAILRAIDFTYTNREEACAIMGRREGVDASTFSAMLDDGIRVLRRADQAESLSKTGKTAAALAGIETVLKDLHQAPVNSTSADALFGP